jgi:hypothetical protein
MVDSADRNVSIDPSPFDFQITKTNSIMNGFFNRIGTTEVVLEWEEPNGAYINNVSGTFNGTSSFTVSFEDTFYNVSTALDYLCTEINSQVSGGSVSVGSSPVGPALVGTQNFSFSNTPGVQQLGITLPTSSVPEHPILSPDIRPFRYLDFTSQQLTYNQDLKDNTTSPLSRDVLCRWYMAWDNPPSYDELGFPILQGYTQFVERRLFNPPKQIKWSPDQPLGNISFQVYGNGEYTPITPVTLANSQFLMTCQLSEN